RQGSRIGFDAKKGVIDESDTRKKVDDSLKLMFRPEFLNRIDATIIFHPLTDQEIRKISLLEINRVRVQLKEKVITLEITDEALDLLSKRGYDPTFGARPLRRIITNLIEDPLSEGLLAGRFRENDVVVVDVHENLLRMRPQREIEETEPDQEAADVLI
ncbi:MAG: NDP-hexose 4-ketoreductase, partial [Chloroflexi bacterium]|nr:NDP-hexose 4-ketoreductase [Chloroflexota bacterium]